ncbi:MAG TPA: class I SAM-dependent methyltransferase [Pyrinomonadaceae bacterium]|nr:class I SAM-dependent methyltransferase [Pyrinomonadaceae bacterium]
MSTHIMDEAEGPASTHAAEVAGGERFEFGKNWARFLEVLDEGRIRRAEESLREMLEVESLEGRSFLDIGSGSGLFSLAARRLGARVRSFDFDPHSVACTAELRRRFFPDDTDWRVGEGSVLDEAFVRSLGQFDVVYSWGVLHHTGQMWRALDHARLPAAAGGRLFVAIYNDTGTQAARWKWLKKTYNRLPRPLRAPFAALAVAPDEAKGALRSLLTLRPGDYVRSWTAYDSNRGMSRWRDIVDWVGGHPYEVATPDEIFEFYKARGFTLTKLKCGHVGLGCNEFVFVKNG